MEIDKSQVLELLKSRGDHDQAEAARAELPDKVDTDKDSNLLSKFGIEPKDLLEKFGGAGGIGKNLGL